MSIKIYCIKCGKVVYGASVRKIKHKLEKPICKGCKENSNGNEKG